MQLNKSTKSYIREFSNISNNQKNYVISMGIPSKINKINNYLSYDTSKGNKLIQEYINSKYKIKSKEKNFIFTYGATDAFFSYVTIKQKNIKHVYILKKTYPLYENVMKIFNIAYTIIENINQVTIRNAYIILCIPNNPTNESLKLDKDNINNLNALNIKVIFDFTYLDFRLNNVYDLSELSNFVIIESFSKSRGLYNVRCALLYSNMNDSLSRYELYSRSLYSKLNKKIIINNLNNNYCRNLVMKNKQYLYNNYGLDLFDDGMFLILKTKIDDIHFCLKFYIETGYLLLPLSCSFSINKSIRIPLLIKHKDFSKLMKKIVKSKEIYF